MSRSRDLANLAGDATGLETITVSDITDLTASAAELNKLNGVTASATEINHIAGATSAVQTQINNLGSRTVPHIIPGVLYPAVGGNDIHGNDIDTSHGSTYTYGATHTDGRKYYYTDIKGSKLIKDPRIGGHFGSQRHHNTSIQILEQETAKHGKNVYSVDGREWMRVVDGTGAWKINNDGQGTWLSAVSSDCSGMVLEITGYFNDINWMQYTYTNQADDIDIKVNGAVSQATNTTVGGRTTIETPLASRFVRSGSLINFGSTVSTSLGTTPKLNTIHIEWTNGGSEYIRMHGIELIAQDTTSTANRSKIQIPSQDVVSYGKKFTVSAEGSSGHHYDPFNGFTSGSSVSSYIDTTTSSGVDNWRNSSTYYRPYNGGRVVKWVDSSGVIKTSVTLMPPNAQNVGGTAINAKANASVANDTYSPTFSGAIDHSLAEVAKTFHWREFGNGSANGNASYADASMLSTGDDIAYVMDDGLTSLSADDVDPLVTPANALNLASDDKVYITFIGTGISVFSPNWAENANAWHHIAQNLPYGSHILRIYRDSSNNSNILLDGVEVKGSTSTAPWKNPSEITFHQPKRPPIPEDAVVLADYMLMADYVELSSITGTDFTGKISKGVRRVSGTRDVFVNASSSTGMGNVAQGDIVTMGPWGMYSFYSPSGSVDATVKLPFFGSKFFTWGEGTTGYSSSSHYAQSINSTSLTITAQDQANGTSSPQHLDALTNNSSEALGNNVINHTQARGQMRFVGFDLQSPIHTSFHYQTFETPFLHELVGGDRNMEQTNLVVSPDGKSWDQITRDTSYIGNVVVNTNTDQGGSIFDEWRGTVGADITPLFNKDWAIAYDRIICLKSGMYQINAGTLVSNGHQKVFVNTTSGSNYLMQNHDNTGNASVSGTAVYHFQRGDYIYVSGYNSSSNYNSFSIIKV